MPAPSSKSPEEREFVVDSGASMHMMSKRDLSSDEIDTLRGSRKPNRGTYSQRRSAHKRGGTGLRSRSWSLRDSATSRRNACCFYRLQKSAKTTDILTSGSAVKKPRLTKEVKDNYMQDGQLRTTCCSKVVHQFWWHFVFNIDIAGFVFNKPSPRAKWRTGPRRLVRITVRNPKPKEKEGWQSRCGRLFAVVGGVHR